MKKMYYTVRPGDTLSEIAEAHDVGLSVMRRWNGLTRTDHIRAGQKLAVWVPGKTGSNVLALVSGAIPAGMEKRIYTVRSGDTLSEIAATHAVRLSSLLGWNALGRTSSIKVGQKLVIFTPKG